MSTNVVNFGRTVNLAQAANLILSCPQNRFLLVGEPGIGKSSICKTIAEAGYLTAYIDVPNMDLGDIAMPIVNKETKQTEYAPSARFRLQEAIATGKKVAIMLDEFSKGMQPVQNMLHPLLEAHNPRLGDIPLPDGSVVFLTGNLSSDGVGDALKAHTLNRIVKVQVRKSTAEEYLSWAVNNDVDPVVCAFVDRYPTVMASYLDDGQQDNPYIYNPKRMQVSYASPRSLVAASNLLKVREKLDTESLLAALIGTVGEATARDLQAFVDYQDQLPKWADMVNNPDKAKVPESAGACAVVVFNAISKVTADTIESFMQYIERFEPEWVSAFCINMARNPQKQSVAFRSKRFTKWVGENTDIL